MKQKDTSPKRTDIFALATEIDAQFSSREAELQTSLDILQEEQNALANAKAQFELANEAFIKEKADFGVLRGEVDAKYAKIRADQALTDALREQAIQIKDIEAKLKKTTQERALSEYNLDQVAQRELALSEREQKYKEEVEKKFVGSFFKG